MSEVIKPEDLPHCVVVNALHQQQQQLEYPNRAAAISAVQFACEAGSLEHTTQDGMWLRIPTQGALFVVMSKQQLQMKVQEMQLAAQRQQMEFQRAQSMQGLPFPPHGR